MQEVNQAVYYTTAQVTEMVELSDQNVRKYVRLLEDREYNVAKDEHNRRLFSGNDVVIIKELIKKAKQPGYTLETAADDIIDDANSILSSSNTKTPANTSNNDVMEMFEVVLRKLETIQDENKELKSNIGHLVARLEHYDDYSSQHYLEYSQASETRNDEEASTSEDTELSEGYEDDSSEGDEQSETTNSESDDNQIAPSVEEEEELSNNIDVGAYEASTEDAEETDEREHEKESDKRGFLSNLFGLFRK